MAWSKALEKFIEVVGEQTSRFSNARLIVADAKAKGEAMKILARSRRDAENILAGEGQIVDVTNNQIVELKPQTQPQDLTDGQRIIARIAHQEAKKDYNIQTVVAYATEEILENPTDDVQEIDEDLVARIFEEIKFVSQEDAQKIWGKILAGAILHPAQISFDLIDFMRKLTKKRAEEITKMGPYMIRGSIVKTEKVENQLKLFFWLQMETLGLITGAAGNLTETIPSGDKVKYQNGISYFEKVLVLEGSDPNLLIQWPIYKLTELGQEVLSLGNFSPDYEYLEQVGNILKHAHGHSDIKILIADISSKGEDKIKYQNAKSL